MCAENDEVDDNDVCILAPVTVTVIASRVFLLTRARPSITLVDYVAREYNATHICVHVRLRFCDKKNVFLPRSISMYAHLVQQQKKRRRRRRRNRDVGGLSFGFFSCILCHTFLFNNRLI